MKDETPVPPIEDEHVRMTVDERVVWAYLATVVVTSGVYFAVMAVRWADGPVDEISWVVPMLWTIGASVLSTVVLTIVLTVADTVAATISRRLAVRRHGATAHEPMAVAEIDMLSDVRDREIDRVGNRASFGVLGTGIAGALVLAMVDADTFWIGNMLFAAGTIGAIVETTVKIRLYRRGF